MKKFKYVFLAVILLPLCFIFTGCKDGLSAYDIAVKNGFVGSEQDWLDSLKGDKGDNGSDGQDATTPDIKIIDGYWYINGINTGVKAEGVDGEYAGQGKSAYEIAVENGFVGTEKEWLESLKGDKGDTSDSVVTDVANKVITSVVAIETTFLRDMGTRYETMVGYGSGIIVDDDKANGIAYILTNHHVVYSSENTKKDKTPDNIYVYLYGYEYEDYAIDNVEIVGTSAVYDLAVLKITSDLYRDSIAKPVTIESSSTITAGDRSVVVGNPLGDGIGVTSGIISRDCDYISMTVVGKDSTKQKVSFRSIRTDTAVNPGNSGGGLFDKDGNLIGVINIKKTSDEIDNMAYAIPTDIATKVYRNILDNSENHCVNRVETGLIYKIASSTVYYDTNLERIRLQEVVKIDSVDEESDAYGILEADDIVKSISFSGKTYDISRGFELVDYEIDFRSDMTVIYNITRNDVDMQVAVTYTSTKAII